MDKPRRYEVVAYRPRLWMPELVCLAMRGVTPQGVRVLVTGVTLAEFDPDAPREPEEIVLGIDEAQALVDSLWSCGLRPTEGAGSAGALAATQKHLETLQEDNRWLRALVERLHAAKEMSGNERG